MNAVGYARFSSHNQTEKSIEAQIREISAYASLSGYNLVKVYTDRAKSGYASDRPEFRQMIRDSASGFFNTVIVHKFDRFGRDGDDAAYFERQLKLNGVKLVSVEEQLDTDTPEGILLKRMIQGINEFYGKNLAREVMKGLKTNALNCQHTGGIPPLGYDVKADKTYSINEHEAESVRIIFNMYDNGHGYTDIINALDNGGYKTKIGRSFGKNSLHDILKNEKYSGVYIYNKERSKDVRGKRNRRAYKDESEIIRVEDGIPAIVEKELFDSVQEKMKSNRRKNARHKAKIDYLLSGKLYCGCCGSAMTGETRRYRDKEYSYYVCNRSKRKLDCDLKPVHKRHIEDSIIAELQNKIFNPKSIDAICNRIYGIMKSGNSQDEIKKVRQEIAGLERKINNLYKAIEDGFTQPETRDRLNQLLEHKRELSLRLFDLEQVPETEKTIQEIRDDFLRYTDLRKLPFVQMRMVIERFVDKIFVYPQPDGGYKVRIIVTPTNPAKGMTDFLDMTGNANPPPIISKNGISFYEEILFLDFFIPKTQI